VVSATCRRVEILKYGVCLNKFHVNLRWAKRRAPVQCPCLKEMLHPEFSALSLVAAPVLAFS